MKLMQARLREQAGLLARGAPKPGGNITTFVSHPVTQTSRMNLSEGTKPQVRTLFELAHALRFTAVTIRGFPFAEAK
jgi:hypothetical protein